MLVDTDVLIDYLRGRPYALEFVRGSVERGIGIAVSAVTVLQLHEGIAGARVPSEEAERVAAALRGLATYPLTHAIAAEAGRLRGELARRGRQVALSDVIIGTTALYHGEALATRNLRDFRRIPGLRLHPLEGQG